MFGVSGPLWLEGMFGAADKEKGADVHEVMHRESSWKHWGQLEPGGNVSLRKPQSLTYHNVILIYGALLKI